MEWGGGGTSKPPRMPRKSLFEAATEGAVVSWGEEEREMPFVAKFFQVSAEGQDAQDASMADAAGPDAALHVAGNVQCNGAGRRWFASNRRRCAMRVRS